MILIAYDGSDDAQASIAQAAKLFPSEAATVATVWSHFVDTLARTGGRAATLVDYDAIDESSRSSAAERAREGADLARAAGFTEVQGVTVAVSTNVAEAILSEAKNLDASAIVLGSRGLGAVKAFFLGSVSDAVLHHADRPVVVIPSPEVAAHRTEHLG